MKKVTIDYVFTISKNLLFKRLSTASGLSEWFADDVIVKNGVFNFKWDGTFQGAKFTINRKKSCIRFDWLDEDKEYMEFVIEEGSISNDISLIITDFVEDDEEDSVAIDLWDNQIDRLKSLLGSK